MLADLIQNNNNFDLGYTKLMICVCDINHLHIQVYNIFIV